MSSPQLKTGNLGITAAGLSAAPGEIAICKAWIQKFAHPIKTTNKKYSVYLLKCHVELWASRGWYAVHISNAAFIQAAQELGYKTETIKRKVVLINMALPHKIRNHALWVETVQPFGWVL